MAVQCGSAVLSFIQFAGSILSGTYNIYAGLSNQGVTSEDVSVIMVSLAQVNEDLTRAAETAKKASEEAEVNMTVADAKDDSWKRCNRVSALCRECLEISNSISAALSSVRLAKGQVLKSLQECFKMLNKNDLIKSLSNRLDALQQQAQFQLLNIIRYVFNRNRRRDLSKIDTISH